MPKAIQINSKPKPPPFGAIPLQTARRIDASDRCAKLAAAFYRYSASMREIEQQFEAKAAALRQAYLDEAEAAHGEMDGS